MSTELTRVALQSALLVRGAGLEPVRAPPGSRDRKALSRDAAHCPSLWPIGTARLGAACAAVLVHARAASALITLVMVGMRMSPLDYDVIHT